MTPYVSVVMPCYNQGRYIEKAVESIINQTYTNWELIIIDDGSTDDSFQIIQEIQKKDDRICCFTQTNGGPSLARNNGEKKAKGKYICFFDSDDLLSPYYFEKGVKYMDEHTDCAVFYSRIQRFGKLNDELNIRYIDYRHLLGQSALFPTSLIRKVDFDRIGGFDESMKGYEDWEMFIRLLYHNEEVYQYPEIMFYYRWNNDVGSINLQAIKHGEAIREYIYIKNKSIYDEFFGCPINSISKCSYLETELHKIINSRTYKLGRLLMAPYRWVRTACRKR